MAAQSSVIDRMGMYLFLSLHLSTADNVLSHPSTFCMSSLSSGLPCVFIPRLLSHSCVSHVTVLHGPSSRVAVSRVTVSHVWCPGVFRALTTPDIEPPTSRTSVSWGTHFSSAQALGSLRALLPPSISSPLRLFPGFILKSTAWSLSWKSLPKKTFPVKELWLNIQMSKFS